MNIELLRAISNADAANTILYVSSNDGMPLVKAELATVNPDEVDPSDASKRGMHITQKGVKLLSNSNGGVDPAASTKPVSQYSVNTGGIELPKVERGFKKGQGGGGAPSKYPFDSMEVGSFIFVPNTDVKNGDAVKTLGSAAGSANQRYAEGTGEYEEVQRAKRGSDHKAIKGEDGKNVMETVKVEKKNFTRKYVVRPVKSGVSYGAFTAPSDGAVVFREK